MTDLREQLLKAGLVSEKDAKRSSKDQAANRKKKGWRQDRKDRAGQAQVRDAALAQRRDAQRKMDLEKQDVRDAQAREERLKRLASENRLGRAHGGHARWYYEGRDGMLGYLTPDDATLRLLEVGQAAIVQGEDHPSGKLVSADIARKIAAEDIRWIRFWNQR